MSLRSITSRDNLEINSPGNLRKFLGLRNTHPHATLLLGVQMTANDVFHDVRHARRTAELITNSAKKRHFDGVFVRMEGPPLESTNCSALSISTPDLQSSEDSYSVSHLDPLLPSDSIPLEDTISGSVDKCAILKVLHMATSQCKKEFVGLYRTFAISRIQWVTQEGLGGIGMSSLQLDDPKGKCGAGSYPSHTMIGK
ncbi:hypothetical protein OSTOST_15517, partial [Ostertagia ostertagi]